MADRLNKYTSHNSSLAAAYSSPTGKRTSAAQFMAILLVRRMRGVSQAGPVITVPGPPSTPYTRDTQEPTRCYRRGVNDTLHVS